MIRLFVIMLVPRLLLTYIIYKYTRINLQSKPGNSNHKITIYHFNCSVTAWTTFPRHPFTTPLWHPSRLFASVTTAVSTRLLLNKLYSRIIRGQSVALLLEYKNAHLFFPHFEIFVFKSGHDKYICEYLFRNLFCL